MKTRAALFHAVGRPLEVEEIDLDEPRPHEVVVRMSAVGICGTDLHQVKGEFRRPTPMVLGHEGAGIVEEVGDAVTRVRAQILSSLQESEEDPSSVAARAFYTRFFSGHPYGHPVDGTAASIASMPSSSMRTRAPARPRMIGREAPAPNCDELTPS